MALTYEKLIKFDLIDEAEKSIDKELLYKIFGLLSEIQSIDLFIKDLPSFPGSTDKIIRGELVSVIGATLSIEGTLLNKEEIETSLIKAKQGELLQRKEQEAENSRRTYQFVIDYVDANKENIVYSEQLVKQIHKYMTDNMNYLSNIPGEYRNNFQATFGEPRKSSLCRTREEIDTAMSNLMSRLNSQKTGILSKNTFIKAMMAHYYLTEIHPFGDGNGRTARALEALILFANGINYYCFWSLANFWSAHKENYLEYLHNIRVTLNPIEFIAWGLEGYRDEIKNIKEKVRKKVKRLMFSDYAKYLLRNKKNEPIKINERIIDVLEILMRTEKISFKKFLTRPDLMAIYKNSDPSNRSRDFKKMTLAGLINVIGEPDKELYIEPNYNILDRITYNV